MSKTDRANGPSEAWLEATVGEGAIVDGRPVQRPAKPTDATVIVGLWLGTAKDRELVRWAIRALLTPFWSPSFSDRQGLDDQQIN